MSAGAQETALQPIAWPVKKSASHCPSSYDESEQQLWKLVIDDDKLLNVKTETLPSEDAHARIAPSS